MISLPHLEKEDSEIYAYLQEELKRQQETLELIASENIVRSTVLDAQGSIATNKYAEGYPGKRYYGGCEAVDKIERLAIERVKALFNAEHANVQPHSGSQANQAVFFALLNSGDTVLSLNLNDGGHLTHGHPVNASGKFYHFVHYGLNDKDEIDFNDVEKMAKEHKPKLIIAGGSAYAKKIDFERFQTIAKSIGAYFMVDMAHYAGLIAAGEYPSPIPFADVATSTTHKTLRGPRGGIILCKKELASQIDKAVFPGLQGGPLMHVIAAKATAFKDVATSEFKVYAKQIISNARTMAKAFQKKGYRVIGNETDCHLLLLDLTNKSITGKQAQELLDKANITINKNSIPRETLSPMVTSGIRIGTPAVTSRGMKELEMEWIVERIDKAIVHQDDKKMVESIQQEVKDFCLKFPIYS
jgi:glycine hydroxymethyltransferase